MLKINNLYVSIDNKLILKDLNLNIDKGQIHAIMGPNGTGKSTLSKVIMGNKKYIVEKGSIIFENKDITNLETDKIAKLKIFLANQLPEEIEGVSNIDMLKTSLECMNEKKPLIDFIKEVTNGIDELKMPSDTINRNVNIGFSGGEKKKNEILQLKLLKPKFIILDEIDSGLDVDSLKIVSENINNYLKENKNTSVLIITHYPRILEYIKPDFVHVLYDGNIKETSTYELALEIEKNGYKKYKK